MKGQPAELSTIDRVFVLIFGAVLLTWGGWLLNSIIKNNLYGYWRTRTEVSVEAKLNSVEWHASHGKGSSPWAEVSYDYQVDGQQFTGSRVSLFKTTARCYLPLKRVLETHQPIRVFIDPSDPRYAVIDREFACYPFVIALPFSLIFVGGGLFLEWCLLMNLLGRAVPLIAVLKAEKPMYWPKRYPAHAGERRSD